jgi:hypothetical protein
VITPPGGVSAQAFVLVDDVVTHEVRNHVVTVLARGAADLQFLGALPGEARSELPLKAE